MEEEEEEVTTDSGWQSPVSHAVSRESCGIFEPRDGDVAIVYELGCDKDREDGKQ